MEALRHGPSHPLAIVALITLLVNDRVLKDVAPGALTGKLSDVAWLVLAPVVVAAVLARVGASERVTRGASLGLVGATFIVLQVWAPLGDAWVSLTGGRHVADVEDLVCLPALALVPLCWRAAPRRRSIVLLPVSAFACAATSYSDCLPARIPGDGATGVDPSVPLAIGNGLFGFAPHDTPGVLSAVTLVDERGEDVPFVGTTTGRTTYLCPIGGLRRNTTYTWTIQDFEATSANHVLPEARSQPVATTTFRTGRTQAFEPAFNERDCEQLVEAARVGSVCGDTGFEIDTGSGLDTGDTAR